MYWSVAVNYVLAAVFANAVIASPYVVMLILTHFKVQSSTLADQAWMVSWPIASTLSGGLLVGLFFRRDLRILFSLAILILVVPAVGGFYTVVKMYLDDKGYSKC